MNTTKTNTEIFEMNMEFSKNAIINETIELIETIKQTIKCVESNENVVSDEDKAIAYSNVFENALRWYMKDVIGNKMKLKILNSVENDKSQYEIKQGVDTFQSIVSSIALGMLHNANSSCDFQNAVYSAERDVLINASKGNI